MIHHRFDSEQTGRKSQCLARLDMHTSDVFQSLFERTIDAVWLLDPHQGVFVDCNEAAVRMTGAQSKEQLLRMRPDELSPPFQPDGLRSPEKTFATIQSILEKKTLLFEWMIQRLDGCDVPVEVSATAVVMNGRDIVVAFSREIAERKNAERKLRELTGALERRVVERTTALAESEARFSVAFNASPIFTSIVRMSDGKFVLANDAIVNWLGYSRQEIIGATPVELGLWDSEAERQSVWHELRTASVVRQRECRWRNRAGELFIVLLSAEIITLDNAPHILCLDLDITQRKKAETEILNALAREKELSQLKSNFVSMVSHEFRTPLGIIQSSSELLREYYDRLQPAEREEQLDSISRNVRRMAGMMEEMLVLSRLEAGKLNFQPVPIDFLEFLRGIVDEIHSSTNRRCDIQFTHDSLPDQASADDRLLRHMFTNLLNNAVKYSEPGAAIRFKATRANGDAYCVIQDEGIGIASEDQQQLFKAFHRGRNVGTRPGTGLGLVLVKRCAELHNGSISIESALGSGTTVTVKLPIFAST